MTFVKCCPIFLFYVNFAQYFWQVVDTSQVFPHPAGPHKRQSLKFLAKQYINRYLDMNICIHLDINRSMSIYSPQRYPAIGKRA